MFRAFARSSGAAFLLAALAGCNTTTPTTAPAVAVNLTGNWQGTLSSSTTPSTPLLWHATQVGTGVAGSLVAGGGDETPGITGTLFATISGTQLTVTVMFAASSFISMGAPSSCSMAATGESTASSTTLSATITETWSAPCIGFTTSTATRIEQVSLTKP